MKTILSFSSSTLPNLLCPTRFFYRHIENLSDSSFSISQRFGQAFHEAMKLIETHENPEFAISKYDFDHSAYCKKENVWMDAKYLARVISDYVGLGIEPAASLNGVPLVEAQFTVPFYQTSKTEVLLKGTLDKVTQTNLNEPLIQDYKTTLSYDTETYLRSYALSGQMLTYSYAMRWLRDNTPGNPFTGPNILYQIHGIFLSKTAPTRFDDSELFNFDDQEMDRHAALLREQVARVVELYEAGTIEFHRDGISWGMCRGKESCPYAQLCRSTATNRETLKGFYKRVPFDPHHY